MLMVLCIQRSFKHWKELNMVGQSYICHRVTRLPVAGFFLWKFCSLFFISLHGFQCCLRLPTVLSLLTVHLLQCVCLCMSHALSWMSGFFCLWPIQLSPNHGDVAAGLSCLRLERSFFHIPGWLVFISGLPHSSEVCHRGFCQKNRC